MFHFAVLVNHSPTQGQFHKRRGEVRFPLISSGLIGVGMAVGGLVALSLPTGAQQRPAANPAPVISEQAVAGANALSQAFRGAADRVLPAVVSIHRTGEAPVVRRNQPGRSGRPQLPPGLKDADPFFRKFFEEMPGMEGFEEFDSSPSQSSGSGVIIDKAGIVLTNNHVVAGGGKITVRLHDGREYDAAEVMTDPGTDLAILKLVEEALDLPAATLGNSDEMQIGDWVLALGQPFGLQDTVTQGIISATNRGIGITKHEEFLQTDAAINPGNSGGPLVNLRGEVIGINTAISTTTGGYQGIGFAIPASVVKWVVPQLQNGGKVHRAFLGVGIQGVDQTLADQLGMEMPTGALVTEVQPNSPAAAAGIKSQDVIVEFGGTKITHPRQLSAVVGRASLKSEQPVKILRDGKEVTLKVQMQEQPAGFGEQAQKAAKPDEVQGEEFKSLGLEVKNLTPDLAESLGVSQSEGVVIVAVADGSPAAKAGLQAGQVIAQVGKAKVKTVDDFTAAMKETSVEKGVLLLIRSEEGSRFVVVKE